MSLRDQILAADDLPKEPLVVPEWGGVTVYVRTLKASERDAFEASVVSTTAGKKPTFSQANFRARLAALCLCDEDGKRLFGDDDVAALGGKSAAALDRIADVAVRLNRMRADSIEEAEGNSDAAHNGRSTSSSPAIWG